MSIENRFLNKVFFIRIFQRKINFQRKRILSQNLLLCKNILDLIYLKRKVFMFQNAFVIIVTRLVISLVIVQLKRICILESKWFGYQRLTMKDPKPKGYQILHEKLFCRYQHGSNAWI